jgi:helix-turn-helix, Psq domain
LKFLEKIKYITWFISDPRISATRALFYRDAISKAITPPHHNNTMSVQTQETRIILAIEAIRTSRKMSRRHAAKIYNVPETSLRNRMNGITPKAEKRNAQHNLTQSEEEAIVKHVLDLDLRGFPPRIDSVEDMANLLLTTRHAKRVGKQWPYRFI